jgi:hypothetical protein
VPKRGKTLRSQFERAEFPRLPQESDARQLAPDRLPFGAAVLAANAVGRKFIVIPAADFVGIGSCQDFDNMVQTHIERRFLPDAAFARPVCRQMWRGE